MILVAMGSLFLGLLCGYFVFPPWLVQGMDTLMSYALILLIFSVGIEVGTNKTVFRKLREYNIRVLIIPLGVVAGSLSGGMVLGLCMGVPLHEAGAVSAGFGFYSLSAVILRELGGSQLGTIAFMSNVLRELLTFLVVPVVAKYCGYPAAVAPGGATAMDTTLPAIAKVTNEETALMAVISGLTLTALVPVLVPLIYGIGR